MKKIIIFMLVTIVAILCLSACTSSQTETNTTQSSTTSSAVSSLSSGINLESAIDIALKDASISQQNATITKSSLKTDDGIAVYEIEFVSNNTKYEYKIAKSDGSIKEFSQETVQAISNSTENISTEKAKSIAVNDADTDISSVNFTEVSFDTDDNKYEIEFVYNGTKYEYDINATDGSILKAEKESIR